MESRSTVGSWRTIVKYEFFSLVSRFNALMQKINGIPIL